MQTNLNIFSTSGGDAFHRHSLTEAGADFLLGIYNRDRM